ncbi:MAG: NrdH-redoxin [Anaerolineaceae bacterium]|nr:NrdH-redoxin [Anaerolineaceae bacterium]
MEKGIIVYGTRWCGDTRRAKKVFENMDIEYEWIDIDKDKDAEIFVKETNNGYRSVPTILFPDGSILVEPKNADLEEKLKAYQH